MLLNLAVLPHFEAKTAFGWLVVDLLSEGRFLDNKFFSPTKRTFGSFLRVFVLGQNVVVTSFTVQLLAFRLCALDSLYS